MNKVVFKKKASGISLIVFFVSICQDRFIAALTAIKKIDPSGPTHYEGFGIGDVNPADIGSGMYTGLEEREKRANDNTPTKPSLFM